MARRDMDDHARLHETAPQRAAAGRGGGDTRGGMPTQWHADLKLPFAPPPQQSWTSEAVHGPTREHGREVECVGSRRVPHAAAAVLVGGKHMHLDMYNEMHVYGSISL